MSIELILWVSAAVLGGILLYQLYRLRWIERRDRLPPTRRDNNKYAKWEE